MLIRSFNGSQLSFFEIHEGWPGIRSFNGSQFTFFGIHEGWCGIRYFNGSQLRTFQIHEDGLGFKRIVRGYFVFATNFFVCLYAFSLVYVCQCLCGCDSLLVALFLYKSSLCCVCTL